MNVFCEDSLRQVVRWIRDVAADGSAEVILRARPATRQSDFEKFVREVAGPLPRRLRIIKEGTVREWIMASDVVASSYSTSLIEAAVAGKPAYMVEPLPIPDPLDAAWYVHAPRLTTRNQFVSACLETVDAASDDRLGKWARAELLGTGDPISNLADVLHRLCTSTMTRPPVPAAETIGVPGRTPTQRIRSQLHASVSFLRTIGSRANGVSSPDSRHDEFDDAEVARRTTAFGRILTQGSRPAHLSQPL